MNRKKVYLVVLSFLFIIFLTCAIVLKINENIAARELENMINEYGLVISEETVHIDGLDEEYAFLFLSDSHVLLKETEVIDPWKIDTDDRIANFTTDLGITSDKTFSNWIDVTNKLEVDGMLLGGDTIDYLSEKNAIYVQNELARLEVPYLYTMGNHDAYDVLNKYGGGVFNNHDLIKPLFRNGDYECQVIEYSDFFIVSINNTANKSLSEVSEEALEQFKKIYEKGKPIILMLHVPMTTYETDSLTKDTIQKWNRAILMGEASGNKLNQTSQEFFDLVTDEGSPVVLVLAGHVHMYHKDYLNDNLLQIVSDTSSNGSGILLRLTGK